MKFGVIPRYKPPRPSVAIMRRNVPTIVFCDLIVASAAITKRKTKEKKDVRKCFVSYLVRLNVFNFEIYAIFPIKRLQAIFFYRNPWVIKINSRHN